MSDKEKAHLTREFVNALNEPLNYERLLDISSEELQFLKNECDVLCVELKKKILREYETIRPVLNRMKEWKRQLNNLNERRDVYKTFLSLDGKESIMSTLTSTRNTNTRHVSFSDIFRDLEDETDEGSRTPTRSEVSVSTTDSKTGKEGVKKNEKKGITPKTKAFR